MKYADKRVPEKIVQHANDVVEAPRAIFEEEIVEVFADEIEVEQAQDTELSLLTEIRNLLKDGVSAETVTGPGTGPEPDTAKYTSFDK